MGRRKLVKEGFLKKGDVLRFRGLKSRIPKLGAWSFELVGEVKQVTPLTVKVIYCNYPSHFGMRKEIEVNRRQWLASHTLNGKELERWKMLSEIDER